MIISFASGKGGTGKTTVATNLALSLNKSSNSHFNGSVQFLDCDVEEPDAHIFLKPKISHTQPVSIPIPKVDKNKCNLCGKCQKVCQFNAIVVLPKNVLVFDQLCHSCGGCKIACPEEAISEKEREIGIIETGKCNKKIEFIHGKLNIGEAMPTPLIKAVKKRIEEDKKTPKGQAPTGQASEQEITIVDVSPGTSCHMVEAVKGSDYCILVTEPTPFGLNDLFLAVEVLKKLKISFGVIINRSDIGDRKVERYCNKENIQILMRIPFDREIARTYSKGIPIVEVIPKYRQDFAKLYEKICTFPERK